MINKLFSILLVCLVLFGCDSSKPNESFDPVFTEYVDIAEEEIIEPNLQETYKKIWSENHDINNDYIGQIFFESELINLPVTYYPDNNYYLRRNFETLEYDVYGTVFEDHNCSFDSQNTILYGHYVPTSYDQNGENIMFTPLAKLMKRENYDKNQKVYFLLQNELREYKVVSVFYCDLYRVGDNWYPNADLLYYTPDFDEAYFEKYKYTIKEIEFYDTGVDFNYNDKFLTLQTCVENREDLRQIVLCKQIGTSIYE